MSLLTTEEYKAIAAGLSFPTQAFIDGSLPKAVNHLASFGRLARQSWLPKRKSR